MGSLSNFAENELLDHVLGVGAYTPAATVYATLCTADPTDAGTGATIAEPGNTGFARAAITFGAAASRAVAQSGALSFGTASDGNTTATHWAILDGGTVGAGNMLAHGALAGSINIVTGSTPGIASGQITVTFSTGGVSTYLANALLDFLLRNTAYSQPTIRAGLATAPLADATTGATVTECANANGYARVAVATWNTASGGASANTGTITLGPPSGGAWGTVTSSFLVDSATHGAGNILFYGNDTVDQAIADGDTVTFAAGAWDVTLD